MMNLKNITLISLFSTTSLFSQNIMNVGSIAVEKKEFVRVYTKNSKLYEEKLFSKQNLTEYADLFALYVMKLNEAKEQKLDTQARIKNELATYKNQLTDKYINDAEVFDGIVRESYEREKKAVDVSHLMLRLHDFSPTDSANTEKRISDIFAEIKSGKISFEDAVAKYSDDGTTSKKGGELGWITALQTPLSFEKAVYETPVGEITKPFATRFGYHIAKINNKKDVTDVYKVAQILIKSMATDNAEQAATAQTKAQTVFTQLKSGKDFATLVKEYSDDDFSKNSNGEINWITVGSTVRNFENAVYSLQNIGELAGPIKTEYGFHIIKLIEKKPLPSFEDRKQAIRRGLDKDERGVIAKKIYMTTLRKKYNVLENKTLLNSFIANLDTVKLAKGEIACNKLNLNQTLLTVQNQKSTLSDFVTYSKTMTNNNFIGNQEKIFTSLFELFSNNVMSKVNQEELTKNNPEYNQLLKDYENGILIFDLMEKQIWQKAGNDTLGMKKYYSENVSKYKWNQCAEIEQYSCSNDSDLVLITTILKTITIPEKAVEELKKRRPQSDLSFIHKKIEVIDVSKEALEAVKTESISKPYKVSSSKYELVKCLKYYPQGDIKTFNEAKGYILSDFQNKTEKDWMTYLKNKYPVKINQEVFNSLVK